MRIQPMMVTVCSAPLDQLAGDFAPAADGTIARQRLLSRTDSKFVLSEPQLLALLPALVPAYDAVLANGCRNARYQTLYFDTPELRSFHDHRRGRRPRHKVRIRSYVDRQLSFVEVKTKRNDRVTTKQRRAAPYGHARLGPDALAFVAGCCDLPPAQLSPRLWTNFCRLTLVGKQHDERITIDTRLELAADRHEHRREHRLEGVVIVEVKQPRLDVRTPAMLALRRAGCQPTSASKYCTGSVVLDRTLRCNRLLPGLRLIEGARR